MPDQTEVVVHDKRPNKINWGKIGVFITTIAMAIFVCAFGYGYFQLSQVNIALAHMVDDLQAQTITTQNNLTTLQQTVEKAQQAQAPDLQQEKMLNDLYTRLTTLDSQLDQLPLLISDVQPKPNLPSETPVIEQQESSWWQKVLNRSAVALQKIVIVRKLNQDTLPISMPEEKAFLLQNLHAQMQAAMWGVLHHNNNVYQTSLAQAITWIQRYFAQDASQTINALQELQELQKMNVSTTAQQ